MKQETTTILVNSIKKLLQLDGSAQLNKIIDRAHAADLAYAFHFLNQNERALFFNAITDETKAANLLTELEEQVLRDFLQTMDERRLVKMLEEMSSDDTADLLNLIGDEQRKELLLTMMRRDELATTQTLLEYDPESAGGLMVPDYLALDENTTAGEAVAQLQQDAGRTEMVFYIYIINEHGHLVGVLSLRELVLSSHDRTLREMMIPEVIRVTVDTDQEEVARLIARYNLVALPVVDHGNQLVGVVTVDDIIDVIRLEATEDMMLMAGAGEQQVEDYGKAGDNFRARMPWLVPSLIAGLCSLILLSVTQRQLADIVPMIVILPLIFNLSNSVSGQSAAIVTRGLALERTQFSSKRRVVFREAFLGALFALSFGVLIAGVLYGIFGTNAQVQRVGIWQFVAWCAGAQAISIFMAATLGALGPLLFERMGKDPALATGTIVTSLASLIAVGCFTVAMLAMS